MTDPEGAYGAWLSHQYDGNPVVAEETAQDAARIVHELPHGCVQCMWEAFGERPQHAPGNCGVCDDLRAYASIIGAGEDD